MSSSETCEEGSTFETRLLYDAGMNRLLSMSLLTRRILLFGLPLSVCGCPPGSDDAVAKPGDDTGVEDTDVSDVDPATVPLGGSCEMADDFGGFLVANEVDGGSVLGTVADGVVPLRWHHSLITIDWTQ